MSIPPLQRPLAGRPRPMQTVTGNWQPATTHVFAISRPARAFTGDFYQYAETSDGLWLAVGDVAGKGLHAAVFMEMIHEELERLTSCQADLQVIVASTNRLLREQMPRNRFASMILATISSEGIATIANAGHPPTFVRHAEGTVEPVRANGPALGLFDSGSWQPSRVQLSPGDALVLYTDGLLEAVSANGEEYGLERIAESVRNGSAESPRHLASSVLEAAERFSGGRFSDDLTLLTARVPTTYSAA